MSTADSSYDTDSSDVVTSESSDYVDDDINDHYQGMMLQGKYVLLHKIGYGAFSTVWLCYLINDPNKQHYYAIKIQNPEDYEDAVFETKLLLKLRRQSCPYILELKDHFEFTPPDSQVKHPSLCMVFDLMACSVYQLIRRGKYKDGLPAKVVLRIAKQVCEALVVLHGLNYVHTDIKPENLLIKGIDHRIKRIIAEAERLNIPKMYLAEVENEKTRQNCPNPGTEKLKKIKKLAQIKLKEKIQTLMQNITGNILDTSEKEVQTIDDIQIVLSDFGTAYEVDDLEPDEDIQTRYYRSPEVILQCGCDERCDLWSVGCMLYEILTGDILFDPEKDRNHSRDFHHIYTIHQICGRFPTWMIDKSPKKREFFGKKNRLRVDMPDPWPINEIIKDQKHPDQGTIEMDNVTKIIQSLLKINPKERLQLSTLASLLV
jgi:serine/threonine-protein kinase SRPK3